MSRSRFGIQYEILLMLLASGNQMHRTLLGEIMGHVREKLVYLKPNAGHNIVLHNKIREAHAI
jgi:hypothetical protein